MRVMHHTGTAVSLTLLLAYPILASVDSYSLTVGGERLEYVRQVDRGYVVKLRGEVGLVHALAGLSALDVGNARPVRGSDRRGVWAVEN